MLTARQLAILAFMRPFEQLTFSELKRRSKSNSNNLLQQAISAFEEEGVITREENHYWLDLDSPRLPAYQELITDAWLGTLPAIDAKEIRRIKNAIKAATPFSAIILFGSFADDKQKKSSDIDVAVMTDDDPEPIEAAVKALGVKNFRKIDLHVINKRDFQEMLANAEFNLGKEIKKKHRLLNASGFYELLATARNPPARRE